MEETEGNYRHHSIPVSYVGASSADSCRRVNACINVFLVPMQHKVGHGREHHGD